MTKAITRDEFIGEITNWDNHRPALWDALQLTNAGVIELGAGYGSTAKLQEYCKENRRSFESYENNLQWLKEEFNPTSFPTLYYIENWDDVNLDCSLLFIDHAPGERRKVDIARGSNIAKIIVIHDTEPAADHGYQMRAEIAKFKYIREYPSPGAWTTMVSNFIEL